MNKDPLLHDLSKVKKRLTLFALTRMGLYGLLGGSLAGAIILAASRIWPLLHTRQMLLIVVGAGLVVGIGLGIWRRASVRDAARQMDRGEPQDAISTALEGLMPKDPGSVSSANEIIVRLQREEAEEAARRYTSDLRRSLPWPVWKRWRPLVFGALAAWLMIVLLLLLPNPLDDRAEALAESREAIRQMEKEREELEKKLEELELPDEEKEKLLKPLDELRKELEEPGVDSVKALKELEAAMKELELAAKEAQAAAQRLQAVADAMTEQRELKKIGEAMQARAAEALADAIDELRSRLRELSPAEREALAEALERLAGQQPQEGAAGELAAALDEAARQVRDAGEASAGEGEPAGGEEGGDGLAALEQALARGLTQGELEELARAAAGQLGQSGRQLAESLAAQGGAVPPSWAAGQAGSSGASPGGGSGASPGSGAGQGSGSGAGQGSGSGAGQGSGSGAGQGSGSGAGQGSGSGAGQGSGSGAGQGSGAGSGVGGRELVTTPRSMQGEGQIENDFGPSNGGTTQNGGQSPMIDGTTRPYNEVYGEYAAEAKRTLGRNQLPASMQDKVKQYFDQIQPD
ncbi:hypothetical protein [Paenibacillus sp. PAMC21692]|uniref:hypothetical protein n=1 Tax=Paenibacillus sp. PAMC21692 TaxID=2762320 RepID=UPI00164DB11F|nr:hypothetical protein [Paenibacillus sp. PAMC21692]QNK54858.1 hypothetical protein H7F31_19665 [Paenibacillus sp. PAMC21692]